MITSGREVLRSAVWHIALSLPVWSRKAVIVAIAIIIAMSPASSTSALRLRFLWFVVIASII
jgi:hypothetical protein